MKLTILSFLLLSALGTAAHAARPDEPEQATVEELPRIMGPAAPVAPEVVARDDKGNATIRAVRLSGPLTFDGRLQEEIYQTVPPINGFIQQLPREGAQPTEATDIWFLFDDTNLYIAARCWDSQPEKMVADEIRRDSNGMVQNESFTVALDTFYDQRNGFFFQTTPLGGVRDQAINDTQQIESWNTVWDVRSARDEQGWTTEMRIPFKSLRYRNSGAQVWGVSVRRIVRWKNETSFLTRVPAQFGVGGISQMASAGTLVGLETPAQSMNLELKPYAVSTLTTDRGAAQPFNNDFSANAGFDFKYGLTRSLILDATVNTDFAQVEEDLQQVNLTRFSLFFPEKRDFFLEGQGILAFGGRRVQNAGGILGDVPIMFFSRQIGLSNGQAVPVRAGVRMTGTAGPYSLALLNIQTGDKESARAVSTNFSTVRVKRDILRRSNVGFIFTNRTPAQIGDDTNWAFGADANLSFYDSLSTNFYYAETSSPGLEGDDRSYRGRFDYNGDLYGLAFEHIVVGENFDPQVGFVRRSDFRRSYANARFSPRLRNSDLIRQLTWTGGLDYVTDAHGTRLENRQLNGNFNIEFNNSDVFGVDYARDYELLPQDFRIAPGVVIPAGGYDYQNFAVSYQLGRQHKVSGNLSLGRGSFYDGTKTETGYNGRIAFGPHFAVEPSISLNWVSLPYGDFTARLTTARIIVTPNPRMMVSSLLQFNASADSLSSSVRFRWEYTPGSELFIVYADGRDFTESGIPALLNRSFAVKVTRLLRF